MFFSLQPSLKALNSSMSMSSFTLKTHGNSRINTKYSFHIPMKKKIINMSQQQHSNAKSNYYYYCESIRSEIEAHLKQAIPLKPPLCVFEPMAHLTLTSPPPDQGPALCVAAFDLVAGSGGGGGHRSQAVAAAAALHLLTAATVAHENLPLTDRPKPNNQAHHIYEPNIELLIPDAMVPFGFELLVNSDVPDDEIGSGRVLRAMVEITRVGGSLGIIEALYQERLNHHDGSGGLGLERFDDTCRKKEGALHACAGACGAILAGANEEEVEKLRKYGLYVGMTKAYSKRSSVVGAKKEALERVLELRNLALKELQHFKGTNIEPISTFAMAP